ncbi:DUF4920 domain-containing protein [Bizionia argentinensis JUB59]|uniref:DUF4920 domain-containing protein n=1 Tax=Bizionia argentinensis JUB59 TaxID=1046627 RepID=G2EF22_9FLAO|nr:DUF4920 domain-containing protein [Bizionia argentinensis]EGV42924.1 DUF4920 domain-containing protein [Bizionia argentinensis JUB59]
MKNLILALSLVFIAVSCKDNDKTTEVLRVETNDIAYASFGEEIQSENALNVSEIREKYQNMKTGDTLQTKVIGKVNSVCQSKGCWMRLGLDNDQEVMVKFKDYGFFMPKNIADKEVIINGKAYITEVSVAEQRHYAEDAGKTAEEIAAITETERTLSFEADGVLLIEE